ncbi:MAG TPA: pilus assembly protein N-terminal domain-containing protein [Candidatus Elarobacter sp.]|jgi:pilus assembly protein CpaC
MTSLSTRAAAFAAVSIVLAGIPAGAQTQLLSIGVGASTIVNAPGMTRVAVGNSSIAGVVPTGNQLEINGKAPGRTTVAIWTATGRADFEVVVTDTSLESIEQVVRQSIDIPSVVVSQVPGTVLVSGTVSDSTQMTRVNDIVGRFAQYAKDKKVSIVNTVTIANPLGDVRRALAANPALAGVRVEGDGKGNVVVGGAVRNRTEAEQALGRVRSLAGPYLAADGKIIDRLATDTTTQIGIKVNILEVDNTALKQLGVRLQGATVDPSNPNAFIIGDPSFIAVEGNQSAFPGRALNIAPFFRLTRLAPTLDALIQEGHARELSAPNLVTTPGQQATFLVGGEVPYAYSTGLGQTSIQFKEYGVKLDMTPTLLANGTVDTKIAPEVSDLDFQSGIQLNGYVVPALKTSKLNTDIVTHDGDSVVMGGLLRRVEQRTISKIPLLGDLPVLGKLFRSTRYQNQETDIVFIMTPDVITR